MSDNRIRWNGMARFHRAQMNEADRHRLDRELADLVKVPPARWPASKVEPLEGQPATFLLHLPHGLRACISPFGDHGIEVHFLTHDETIRFLQGADRANGEPA
jgi:hypothetical protein